MAPVSREDRPVSRFGLHDQHTHDALENFVDLLTAIMSVESSYRGFLFTGKESYLESCRASVLSAEQGGVTPRTLTVQNPRQQNQVSALERLTGQNIRFGQAVIDLRRDLGSRAATNAIRRASDRTWGQRMSFGW